MNKHIILTLGRSGSSYLSDRLNNHPNIRNYGEVLGDWTIPFKLYTRLFSNQYSVEQYLDYMYQSKVFFLMVNIYSSITKLRIKKKKNKKHYNDIETIGIKDFSFNFIRKNLSAYLSDRPEISVINLYRKNILKRFVSLEKMNQSGIVKQVSSAAKREIPVKIRLDIPYTISQLEIFSSELNDHHKFISTLPPEQVLNISYEELFSNDSSLEFYIKMIFEFLGVDENDTESRHKKILPDNLEHIIENYDELSSSLLNTRYACYLD